jgi:hypothetical protein
MLGEYDTAAEGWTLAGCELTAPEEKTNFIEKVGGDGSWDLSTVLTDGLPTFRDRVLTVRLERSDGNRQDREAAIKNMVNRLHGLRVDIILPDDDRHFLSGKLHVAREFSDLAHAAVNVTATCDPWLYAVTTTRIDLVGSTSQQTAQLVNNGRQAVVPTLLVKGADPSMLLEFGDESVALSNGAYQWPELLLTPGVHGLNYTGAGQLAITYREAVLE